MFVFIGCRGNKQSADDFITVDVTTNYPKKELILQDFLDIEYIPLETNDEFITAANIQAIGKDIIILRNNSMDGDIYIFDRKGKALRKINRRGQGGEEYTNILGIALDESNGEIFINNHFSNKIVVYDLFGNFKRSFRQKEGFFYNQIGDFNQDYLICHDGVLEYDKPDLKRNCFLLVSKQDGNIQEIQTPYKEKISTLVLARDVNGEISNDRLMRNRELIPSRDSWILAEPSTDTIYSYLPDHTIAPYIVRTPSIQSMDPKVFLFPGVLTDRYCFIQTVKKTYDFITDNGFPRTDLVYDKKEKSIFECIVSNRDFVNRETMSLVYEIPMFTFVNKEIVFAKRIEAHELVEAYQKGYLKGKLKEIAATLEEESNPVVMLAKHKE